MVDVNNIVAQDGYLVDETTGMKIVFYECDPTKNTECSKTLCRYKAGSEEPDYGFCAKTPNPAFCKDGGKAFYAVLKDETYWGREYVNE